MKFTHEKHIRNKIRNEKIEIFEVDVGSPNITRIKFSFTRVFA